MAYQQEYFELRDVSGTTIHVNGTVGTTPAALPASGTTIISEVIITVPKNQDETKYLLVSFDNQTTWFDIAWGGHLSWSPKGGLTQIHVKGNKAGVKYQALINKELE